MTISLHPYLFRAYYDWIVANNWVPYIEVNTKIKHVIVPEVFIREGKITLNISPYATHHLKMTNRSVEFNATFSGESFSVFIPLRAIQEIYPRENRLLGIILPQPDRNESSDDPPPSKNTPSGKKPFLSIVK